MLMDVGVAAELGEEVGGAGVFGLPGFHGVALGQFVGGFAA
jgi:hypothetical protein